MSYYNKLRKLFTSASIDNELFAELDDSQYIVNPVAIYGGGQFGELWLKYFVEDKGLYPKFFIDRNAEKQGKDYLGIPVVSLEDLAAITNGKANIIITPYSLNTQSELRMELEEYCSQWAFKLYFIPAQYSKALEMRYAIHQENCLNVIDMLYDDFSKASYYEYIRSKMSGETYRPPYFDYDQQYIANDLFLLSDSDFIADCGAYEGDTLEIFCEQYPDLRGIASFEPTPDTFQKLEAVAGRLMKDNIRLFNMATGDRDTTVYFSQSNTTSENRVSQNGDVEVKMCTLDEVIFKDQPSFIKMDVEGSELATLHGARQIISSYTPILAICIYHKTEDLFEIPYFIRKEFPAYRLYVRKYSNDPYELVLFAVPPSRCIDNLE